MLPTQCFCDLHGKRVVRGDGYTHRAVDFTTRHFGHQCSRVVSTAREQVKSTMRSAGAVLISHTQALSPLVVKPLKFVTHGQCDARPTVTLPVAGHRCRATGTKLYCWVTEAHVREQLAQGRYLSAARPGVELATSRVASQHPNHHTGS